MPWSLHYYPPAMKNLPGPVRAKAIEIANALLDEGYDEGKAIRIALAKARDWADRHAEDLIGWNDTDSARGDRR